MIVGSTNLVIYTLNLEKRKFCLKLMLLREVGSFFVLVIVKNISLLTTLILLVRILSLLGKTFAGNTNLLHNCYCCGKFSAFQEKLWQEILVCCKTVVVGNSQLFRKRFEASVGLFWDLRISLCRRLISR